MYQRVPDDLFMAVQQAYSRYTEHGTVRAIYALKGAPDELQFFQGFCTATGGVRGFDEMQRITNAILNAAFYVAAFATSQSSLGDFDFDVEIPALYVPERSRPKPCLLYAIEATLDLTPWTKVESQHVRYDLTASIHACLILKRDLMLAWPASCRYSSIYAPLLLPAIATTADWFSQQREPVRYPARELDTLIGEYLQRGQLAAW